MDLENYSDFVEYVLDKFESEDSVTVISDYYLADVLNSSFGNRNYSDYKGIDLQSDVNEYCISKIGTEFFCIEPLKHERKIKTITDSYFIVDGYILEDNPTLFDYLEKCVDEDLTIEVIDYEEDYYCNNCSECESTEDNEIDLDELFGSDSITDNEDYDGELSYFQLADLIEEYVSLILDNDCKEEIIGYALTEFAGKVLENFCLEKE